MKGKDKKEAQNNLYEVMITRVMLTLESENHTFNKVGKYLKDH